MNLNIEDVYFLNQQDMKYFVYADTLEIDSEDISEAEWTSEELRRALYWRNLESYIHIFDTYWKDKNSVYCIGVKIPWADPDSFSHIWWYYMKDKNAVYLYWKKVEKADPKTFESCDKTNSYFKDKSSVFYDWKIISEADVKTFESVSIVGTDFYHYAKDSKHVYLWKLVIPWADPKTFKAIDPDYSYDDNFIYCYTAKIEWADPETFEFIPDNKIVWPQLNWPFARDKKNVYFLEHVVEWADPITFFVSNCTWFDKNRTYDIDFYSDNYETSFLPHKYFWYLERHGSK